MGAPTRLQTLLTEQGLEDLRRHRQIPRELRRQGQGFALVAASALDDEMKRAVSDVRDEAKREREQLTDIYSDTPPRDVLRQVEQRSMRREREAKTMVAQTALDDLAGWYRDVLMVRCGGDPADTLHSDDAQGLRADADALSERALVRSIDTIFARREELEFNVQISLAIEALLLDLSTLALTG
jgi:hypothetical protein